MPYEFTPLPLKVGCHVFRTYRKRFWPASETAVDKTYNIDHYVVQLVPPSGWSVNPDHYDIRADTDTADFVLQRK